MSNLVKRSIYGSVYVLVMLGGTIFHPIVFAVVFGVLLFFTQLEFYKLIEQAGYNPSRWTGTISGIIFFFICFGLSTNLFPKTLAFTSIPIILLLLIFQIFSSKEKTLENGGLNVLGFIYIALPFSLLNYIVHPTINGNTQFYPWILVGIYFILWVNDSFAYFVGSAFGKHKMCKKISPLKSWEGLIGGAIFGLVMGVINAVIFQGLGVMDWIIIATITVTFGTLGDLFESKIKRETGVKDAGNILPGHGGFLDRLDSLLFVIPAVFFWLIFSGNI